MQRYIHLIDIFLSSKIAADVFVEYFLEMRRVDTYWFSSMEGVYRIMDSIFLDIDEHSPDDLYDPNDKFNINENELRKRLDSQLSVLNRLVATW